MGFDESLIAARKQVIYKVDQRPARDHSHKKYPSEFPLWEQLIKRYSTRVCQKPSPQASCKTSSILPKPHSKSSRSITSGGAILITVSCVSLHSTPRSRSASQNGLAAVFNSIASHKPLPRTETTCRLRICFSRASA